MNCKAKSEIKAGTAAKLADSHIASCELIVYEWNIFNNG